MSKLIIEAKNISKTFSSQNQSTLIFESVNLNIKSCETVSICGNSGSGKTTLINVLGLLEQPDAGEILWDGTNVTKEKMSKIAKLRSNIFGYIFQQCNLIPELNVIENILFPKRITSKISKQDIELAENLLEKVQLQEFSKRDISTLSGGERQRIAVIRALINNPKIVVADEPTGSLDEKSADSVMDMIIDLCRMKKSALLLITHNSKFAQKMETSYVLHNTNLTKFGNKID